MNALGFSAFCSLLCAESIRAAQLLRDGVGFRYPAGNYEWLGGYHQKPFYAVFSHEGDYLGELTCFEVDMIYRMLKKTGRQMGYCPRDATDQHTAAVTLAWEGMWP